MIWHFATEVPPLTTGVSLLPNGERLWRSSDSLLLYFWEEGDPGGEIFTGRYFKPEGEPGYFQVEGRPDQPVLWAEFENPFITCRTCGRPMPSTDIAVLLRLGWKMDGEGGWICEEDQ